MANIVVFCGSSRGASPEFHRAAEQLGAAIAGAGHRLVYGGGSVGLMGVVADTVIAAGGEAVGVITDQLVSVEIAHGSLTELVVESTMHERKAKMAAMADGVIVLPGGFGTYDEAFEILTWNQLGLIAVPVVFLDVDGFYAPLFEVIRNATDAGFVRDDHAVLAQRTTSSTEAVELATHGPARPTPKWVV